MSDYTNKEIEMLLQFANYKPETYNKIANILHKDLNITGAEITLVCLYVHERMKEG